MKSEFFGTLAPQYKGWAKNYVEAEAQIPEAWRELFYEELTSDDMNYRAELELALKVHGVRWV